MPQLARYFLLLAGAAWATGCAGSGVTSPLAPALASPALAGLPAPLASEPSSPNLSASSGEEGPRLFPALDAPGTSFAGEERDGSRRLVAYGLRVLARPGGAVELAREYLPVARTVQSLELPARLGGGFLFSVLASSGTLLFRAPTFTGELEPFARLDFEAAQIIAGFDRLYVLARHPERILALDAEHGTAIGMGSLPPSPSYLNMAFVDSWFGAVQLPFRGTLLTFDAGASWRPLDGSVTHLAVQHGALRLALADGELDLDSSGNFTRRDPPSAAVGPPENAVAQALRASTAPREEERVARDRLGQSALKLAVLRGFRDRDGSFVVANAGTLLRVRPSDGQLLDRDEHAYPGGGECSALPFRHGFGFACSEDGQTALYSFVPPFAMRRLRTFSGARYVSSSGNGAVVVRGACSTRYTPGAYCVSTDAQSFREIRVRGDWGVERVVALADGRVAVIVPPRLGARGFLSLIDARGQEQRLPLQLPKLAGAGHLLENGLWLDGWVEQAHGLSGWVVGSEPFAGVRVALDGTVTLGRPESSIDRALLSGPRALLVGRTGRARESSDGGFEWTELELPSEFDAARELRDDARLQGCSELGCAFAGFVRVGWPSGRAAARLRMAPLPAVTPTLSPRGSRWVLRCEATGEVSEAALPASGRSRGPAPRAEDSLSAPWAPFLELPAPALAPGMVGFDTASSEADAAPVHAYVWGARGSDWARVGYTQLRAVDRFQVQRGVLESAVTRSPWSDATSAAEAFGFDGTSSPISIRAVMDAGQRAAAVLLSSRGLLDLLLFEEGKAVARVPNAARLGFGMLSSAAKVGDAWYVAGFNENHALSLSKIAGGRVDRLAEYPDVARDISSATLVRSTKGEELGVWVTGFGWYLFPIDPVSHALQSPLYESPAALARMPAPCSTPRDADGFLLAGAPSLEPSLRFAKGTDELAVHRVAAQFVWSARGLCTRALAADSEAALTRVGPSSGAAPASARRAATVPLTISERRPQGRRWGYVCAP